MNSKQPETSRKILKNAIYGFSTWFLPLGLSFAATPIIVGALGHTDYGIYALVLGFIGYSFNLNTGRAITKYVAEYRIKDEIDKVGDVISTTFLINIAVGFGGFLTVVLMARWLVADVFLIDPSIREKTVVAFYLAAGIIFVTMLNQVFSAVLQGFQRFDIFSKIINAGSLLTLLGSLWLALQGFGLLPILLWNLIVLVVIGVITAISAFKILPGSKFRLTFNPQTFRKITGFSAGVICYQIVSNFLLLFERGWIVRKLGEESLTLYVVPMSLGIYLHGFISSLLLMLFPLASELNEDREKLKRLYLKSTKIVCFFVVFICISLIVESKPFLTLWMGAEFAERSWQLLVIHAITFAIAAVLVVTWQMTEGLGYPFYNSAVFIVCLIICLSLMIALTQGGYGNIGVAVGRLAGFSALFFSIFIVEKWFFGRIQYGFWLKIGGMIALAALGAAGIELILLKYLPLSWLMLFLTILAGGGVYCLILWGVGFITEEDKLLVQRLKSKK